MTERGRPEKLNDDLKRYITEVQKGRVKRLKAPAVVEEVKAFIDKTVRKELQDIETKWSEVEVSEEVARRLPGLSSIQKYLQEINLDTPSDVDEPWQLAATPEMPAEVLPLVLEIQRKGGYLGQLSIRQAQWIMRLHKTIPDIVWLDAVSGRYALYEKLCEASQTTLSTLKYDRLLTSPEELIGQFDLDRWQSDDRDTYRKTFQIMTGLELRGVQVTGKAVRIVGETVWVLTTDNIFVETMMRSENIESQMRDLGVKFKIVKGISAKGIAMKTLVLRKPIPFLIDQPGNARKAGQPKSEVIAAPEKKAKNKDGVK